MNKIDIDVVKDFIEAQSPETKVYLGVDSERLKIDGVWHADYCLAIVIHIDGKHGCKVFGEVIRERDWDNKPDRPIQRLMTETYKIAELFLKLEDVLVGRDFQIHLDLNKSEEHGSSCAVQQAIGYIRGVCNVTPHIKPDAPAASFAADRLKAIIS
jgi:predicted RNase H-related nuclease YkuK (DUF458 family)